MDDFETGFNTWVEELGCSQSPARPPTPRTFDIYNDRSFSGSWKKSTGSAEAELILEFLHDLRTSDSAGRGVLNLCLDYHQVASLAELDVSRMPEQVLQSSRATITAKRRLYWRTTPSNDLARIMAGPLHHPKTLPWYNVSMPILPQANLAARAVQVHFLGADPRSIDPDLHQIWMGWDPQDTPALWERVERNLGASKSPDQCDCRVLLASTRGWLEQQRSYESDSTNTQNVGDRALVDSYLSGEVSRFREITERHPEGKLWRSALKKYTPGLDPQIKVEDFIDSRISETAMGVWLLDPVDLRPLPPDNGYFQGKIVTKVPDSGVKPELCLFNVLI